MWNNLAAFSLSLFLFAFFQASSAAQGDVSSASTSFEKLKSLLFQVKTSSGATAEKSSYGTGFVVGRDGYLLTNYHVIAGAIWQPLTEKVFVVVNRENIPAQIIDVDVVHDLALIKTPLRFPKTISLANLPPQPGATLHSLGLPEDLDWTVVTGVYNGLIKRGPYELVHLTTPLNPGMSGGPTVNTRAELVGINVSGLMFSQSISFAVPLRFAKPLIAKAQTTTPPADLIQSIHSQLRKVQDELTTTMLASLSSSKKIETWTVPNFANEFKCWGQKSLESEKRYVVTYEKCEIDHRTQLTPEISTGFLRIETSIIQNNEYNFFSFFHFLNLEWARDEVDPLQIFSKNIKVNYGPYECQRARVPHQTPIQVEICTRALIPFTDLFEIHVKAIQRIGSKQALKSYLILDGLSQSNFLLILDKYLKHFGELR
jgi:serine protease Do